MTVTTTFEAITPDDKIKYPCLMRHMPQPTSDYIVYFTHAGAGVVVASKSGMMSVGNHATEWDMNKFIPFYGTVTLVSERN